MEMEGFALVDEVGPGKRARVTIKARELRGETTRERVRNLLGDLGSVSKRA